jgi:predicted kinase
MSQPICTVMVGLPGLGKSTHIESERKLYARVGMGLFVYSTDAYIEEQVRKGDYASYDEAFEHCIDDATKAMNTELDKMISWKNDVIWDQTNLGVGKRRKIINRMKQAGYQVRCVCILPPESDYDGDKEDWMRRLANRPDKTIPNDVLTKMLNGFIVPTIGEGFDMITFYNMHGALLGIDYGEKE